MPAEILKMLGLKKKRFEIGERYYYIDYCGDVKSSFWDNHKIDIYNSKHNNAFHTEEQCKFKCKKQEVLAELRQFAEENNTEEIDWENEERLKWYIFYNYIYKTIGYSDNTVCEHINEIYFTSEELAKQAVAKIGEDRIKKYLFGVGE